MLFQVLTTTTAKPVSSKSLSTASSSTAEIEETTKQNSSSKIENSMFVFLVLLSLKFCILG